MRRVLPLLGALALAASAAAASDPGRLVFLVRYVGSDYDDAVRDGQVVDRFEYGEVFRFTRDVQREYAARPEPARDVTEGLAGLERLVVERAPNALVRERVAVLVPALAASLGVLASGPGTGDAGRGGVLFAAACAVATASGAMATARRRRGSSRRRARCATRPRRAGRPSRSSAPSPMAWTGRRWPRSATSMTSRGDGT